jgi:hypothetical protein
MPAQQNETLNVEVVGTGDGYFNELYWIIKQSLRNYSIDRTQLIESSQI